MLDHTKDDYLDMASSFRALAMEAVEAANSGHPGAPMGMADIAAVLYARHLKFDVGDPDWPDRDRVILSNGHASAELYAPTVPRLWPSVSIKNSASPRTQ